MRSTIEHLDRYIRAQIQHTMPQDSGARLKSKRKATLKLAKRKAAVAAGTKATKKATKKKS